jgi:hypothetical protein
MRLKARIWKQRGIRGGFKEEHPPYFQGMRVSTCIFRRFRKEKLQRGKLTQWVLEHERRCGCSDSCAGVVETKYC